MEYVNWNKKRIPAPVFNDVLEPAFGGKAEAFSRVTTMMEASACDKEYGQGTSHLLWRLFCRRDSRCILETLSIQTPAHGLCFQKDVSLQSAVISTLC